MTRRPVTRVMWASLAAVTVTACGGTTAERSAVTTQSPITTDPIVASQATIPTEATITPPTSADRPDATVIAPVPAASEESAPIRSVTLGGRGSEYGVPDRGIVDLGVSARRATVIEATTAASDAGAAMIAALEAVGVPTSDVQTSQFSIQPYYSQWDYTVIAGYETTLGYRVVVPDVAALGSTLATAVEAGGDSVRAWSVSFEGDPADHIDAARAAAWADVRARAAATALEIGEPIGKLLDVHEKVLLTSPAGMSQGGEGDSASFEVPVSPGVVGVIVLLTVTYQIGE
jgi:uncharacterized protein